MSGSERAAALPQWTRAAATWRDALLVTWAVARRDRFALAGLIIYAVLLAVALAAPALAPYNPLDLNYRPDGDVAANEAPSLSHWLGTTNLGRDVFSQVLFGTRVALVVGFVAAFGVVVLGTLVGLVAGYYSGWVDTILMRLGDVACGIPFLPMGIVLVAFLGPSIWNTVLVMVLLLWRDTGRVIRAQVLSLRTRSYVEAARVLGASHLRTMFVHIAPNVLPLSFLYGSLAVGWAILTEATISFLGFGDPNVISWGFMLQDAYNSQAMARHAFYWFVPPGLCIMLAVMAGFFIGRGYEELLFPRLLQLSGDALNNYRWRRIAMVPQAAMDSLDPVYRVGDQLVETMRLRGGLTSPQARERAERLFALIGLEPGRLRLYPHELSGGMKQRVVIAMALALDPQLVIADEPVTALDVIVQHQVLRTLRELQETLQLSLLLITHDISVVADLCDDVAVMYAGRIVEAGSVREVFATPHHPYTMGLRNAFPSLRARSVRLVPIEGYPPDLASP